MPNDLGILDTQWAELASLKAETLFWQLLQVVPGNNPQWAYSRAICLAESGRLCSLHHLPLADGVCAFCEAEVDF